MLRPIELCRTWLYLDGADEAALINAATSGADILTQELEDFTPPDLRPAARVLAPDLYATWRAAGAIAAVRVNPLELDGLDDLAGVMKGAPDIVALPKVGEPEHIVNLDTAITRFEREYGIPEGSTRIWPNIELARGLVQTDLIANASQRVIACGLASEDLAADLGAERGPDGTELDYCRRRFLVECVAAGTTAIDCPFTWNDPAGVHADTLWARRLGYKSKSVVKTAHASIINEVMTPSPTDIDRARRIVAAFEKARAAGQARVEVDGSIVEVPIYMSEQRLLQRAEAFAAWSSSRP